MDKFPSRERAAAAALEPRVTAVIVARSLRGTGKLASALDLCLRSVQAEPWIDDIVVVDLDNSSEISARLRSEQADRRDMKVVRAPKGASLAAAANLGAARARGRWLLFLDPDVVLQRGAVARMAAAGGEARTPWIVGGRLVDTEGRERPAARAGALTTWSAIAVAMDWRGPRPLRRRGANSEPSPVAAVSGAFMLMPRADFEKLGAFDEKFATDAADLDLCRRAADAGGSIVFQPAAAGVQFAPPARGKRRQAQGLALFAAKSAKTPIQRAFAVVAGPALAVLVTLRDFVAGRPTARR